ncbi:MAG TPA: outer membrane beta-barrel protein, partial [Caulobacterales bacterium]|nr:outer membrane beta-barrel protein [Caulobacterales bacterium]
EFGESADTDHKDDVMGSIGIGYAFANGWRFEGEFAGRSNREEIDGFDVGDTHAWSVMLNGYYDFNKNGWFQPYLGAGIGAGRVSVDSFGFTGASTRFAYQGMAGVAFPVSPQLSVDVGYRYFRVNDLKYTAFEEGPFTAKADYDHQAVTAGLRWQFAPPPAPPPPPPPAEAPPPVQVCPANEFKVYFEWDRSNLNAAAMDTINHAIAQAKACNVSTVSVKGYTDTSGSAKYNIGLSNRRAAVVRDALVSGGIPATLITTEGLGETDLDKPTKDGVREPLNRRTAVTISFQ